MMPMRIRDDVGTPLLDPLDVDADEDARGSLPSKRRKYIGFAIFPVVCALAVLLWVLISTLRSRVDPAGYTKINPAHVLVLQADDRPLSLITPETNLSDVPFWTATAYSMSAWARRHGYHYQRATAKPIEGLHVTWWKLANMRDALDRYDYVLFLDSDAFLRLPMLSLDDLRRRWGMTDSISLLASLDNDRVHIPSTDEDVQMINSGVLFWRSTPTAKEMLDRLMRCPFDIPECDHWKRTHFHEQSAFNVHIRPLYVEGKDYVTAPCEETYGTPTDPDCHGTVIRHRTGADKQTLTAQVMETLVRQQWEEQALYMHDHRKGR